MKRAKDHRAIEAAEQQEAAAMLAGDVAALETLWDEHLLAYSTANIYAGKSILLDMVRRGRLQLLAHERKTLQIIFEGKTAIAIGNENSEMVYVSAGQRLFCSYMNVWIKRTDGWKLLARYVGQSARIPRDANAPSSGAPSRDRSGVT